MGRGELRIYLGAAPGVGKTYAMLCEAHRRIERGSADIVVGYVETHGRAPTTALLDGLEIIPRRQLTYRAAQFTELDVDAVLARRPTVALIDELAHTNVPGSRNTKRWQDVAEILDAGITVITTVNIQHLESLGDVVRQITDVGQHETVPDDVVRQAGQIELVDMAPDALRRRMAHGNIYPPEKIDAALGNYFQIGNLTALRELALLWAADKVDDQLDRYRAEHGITGTWATRERVVVALTGGPEGDTLIRRAARITARTTGADLLAVHVARSDGLTGASPANLARQRALTESVGGTYHQVVGDDIPRALLDFARGVNATQLVLGASRRGQLAQLLSHGVGVTTTVLSGPIDVHLVTHEQVHGGRQRGRRRTGLPIRRRVAGFLLTAIAVPLVMLLLTNLRGQLALASDILVLLIAVVAAALVGGLYPALLAAVVGFLLLNFFFTPPFYTFTIAEHDNAFALVAFVIVAVAVSTVVDLAARRTQDAAHASAEAEVLFTLAGSVLRGENALGTLLERLRETFALTSVSLLERIPETTPNPDQQRDPTRWSVASTVGGKPCTSPDDGDLEVPIDDDLVLVLRGRPLPAADRRILEAFAAQAVVALRQQRLAAEARQAAHLDAADRMRTALLAAVSHEFRTPLASATAAIESLRAKEITWTDTEREELLATAWESLERLDRLVANLLDMSRLQAGALGIAVRPLAIDDAVALALPDVGQGVERVRTHVADNLPEVQADPALTERILVNLIGNALHYSPAEKPVLITASALADRVELHVVDRGPGIPVSERDRVFLPFQRLGDRDNHPGVGLGLALSRGLAEAMGGSLVADDTPGGGLTMILTLPAVPHPSPRLPDEAAR